MYKRKLIGRALLFVTALCSLAMGFIPAAVAAEDETEILNIIVGKPTFLSSLQYQNSASVAVSRTGTVAAFYPKLDIGGMFYRTSTDAGRTWGKERTYPWYVGPMSVGLREGGVLNVWNERPVEDRLDQIEVNRVIFSDDFLSWETETAKIHVPNYAASLDIPNLCAAKGKIIQFPSGNLLMPMYGGFEGDSQQKHRSFLVQSSDQGRNWDYYATIDYTPKDPHPELPGYYLGACEPSVAILPNGQMLAMLRKQYADLPGEYKPMYVSWSNDVGRTWTRPTPTKPHLMCISPTVQVLENGVVACEYGRPGFHVAFSLDNGHSWQDRISFSHLPDPPITGQFDMVKVGPNKLVAVGSDAAGTKVWPIAVQRVKVSQTHALLEGRVLDEEGKPIAGAIVERGPNRYTADDWVVKPGPESWRHVAQPHFAKLMVALPGPLLAYRSIQKPNGYPIVSSDAQGQFRFQSVKLGGYVLTVEAKGYAPQHRHIKVGPEAKPHDFRLKPGKKVCNRVMDNTGRPVRGACVGLDLWHCHTDSRGFYHWSVEAPLPKQVDIRVYKRWVGGYEVLKTTVPFSQLENQPITLKTK